MNHISIIGRLVKDPELQATQSGIPVCNITVAVDRSFTENGKRDTDFFSVVCWKRTAEFVSNYFCKGRWISVDGRMQSRKWKDKDGGSHTNWEIMADEVGFCGDRKEPLAEEPQEDPPRRRAADFGGGDDADRVPF